MYKLTEQEEKERMDLYNKGLDDKQMSEIIHFPKKTIQSWRFNRGLPGNKEKGFQKGNLLGSISRLPKEEHELRMRLYNKGLIDRKVAKVCHVSNAAIYKWRRKYNLPANGKYIKNEE